MLRLLSFILAASLFINIVFFAKWKEIKKIPQFAETDTTRFDANPYALKIVEPTAVTKSIGNLQKQWWDEAVGRQALKSIVDRDFPEESPILY